MSNLKNKLKKLKTIIKKYPSALVAYSGGVDSSFLLYMTKNFLKDKVVAVTAVSETYSKEELKDAIKFAKNLNVRHEIIKTDELKSGLFKKNTPYRCFWCKKELFRKIEKIRKKLNYAVIFDGANYDDINDFRPGENAKKLFKVVSPLKEAKLTKNEIRILLKKFKLPFIDKPQNACLASRIVFGVQITDDLLKKAYLAEKIIKKFWHSFFRVRLHSDEFLRIEVRKKELRKFFDKVDIEKLTKNLKNLGFKFITFDLEGYIPAGLKFKNEKTKNNS